MNLITLILALIAVESSGNDNAIGDGGLAYGCLQLHAAYVQDRKSTRLNSSHGYISYAVFCLKKKNTTTKQQQ